MVLKPAGQPCKPRPLARLLALAQPLRFGAPLAPAWAWLVQQLGLRHPRRRLGYAALGLASLGTLGNTALAVAWQQPELALVPSLLLCLAVAGTLLVGRRQLGQLGQLEQTGRMVSTARARAEATLAIQHARQRQIELDLAKVAHDVADPLTVISGYARLLLAQAESDSTRRMAQQVVSAGDRLGLLIADLKTVSREPDADAPEPSRAQLVDLCGLARAIVDDYRVLAAEHRLLVETPEAAVLVRGEPGALTRVLTNLVSNAVRYSPPGSPIRLSVQAEGEQQASLRVEDHGIGIPEAERERIFEPFYRGSNAVPFASGTGIGLAGVREIVARHGGSISVDSRLGSGTTFIIRLPLVANAAV